MSSQEEPQTQTQEEFQDSQELAGFQKSFDHLWAYLLPITKEMKRVDFFKPEPVYRIGRNVSHNAVIFPGYKISNRHAEITWDGRETVDSTITVKDLSSNGTFVNGVKLGRGNSRILTDGAEIAFGSVSTSTTNPYEDYRFIFRHAASGQPPQDGFYALYDTSHQLGKGSFATVIKCMERKTGFFWAAKMFSNPVQLGDNADNRADRMVSREIEIMQKLSHPNICFLKDMFILPEGKLILVLELVKGGDLLEYILSNGGLSEDTTQHIAYQLCLALSYIHSLGIAHRDLKPENVLLTELTDDNLPNVKVADFGLAKATDSQTMLKTMCGTPAYLAPEVVQQTNMEGYDNLVDSWSVGVIVFSMLTNASPFLEDENQPDLRLRIATRQIDWNVLKQKTSNPKIIDFIKALLTDDPKARLTLTRALDHPWLKDYVTRTKRDPVKDRNLGKFRSPAAGAQESTSNANGEQSKTSSAIFSQGFENLALNDEHVPGPSNRAGPSSDMAPAGDGDDDSQMGELTPPPSSQPRSLQAQNSRVLRRRKDVLDEAMEHGEEIHLSHPSPELVSRFEEQHNRAADEAHEAGPSNRPGKRGHGDLNAVPEGEEVANGDGGAAEADLAMNVDEGAQPAPSKRPRQTTPAKGRRGKKPDPDSTTLRRSTRTRTK